MSKIVDDTFVYWAAEREMTRLRKEEDERATHPKGGPYSNDPIIANHHFCNVSREDDRVTRWIARHIRIPFNNHASPETLFAALCLARFINLPSTLDHLLKSGAMRPERIDLQRVTEEVLELQKTGVKCFSSAYMVRSETNKDSATYGTGKIAYISSIVAQARVPGSETRKGFTELLAQQYGFGPFMAGQVAADAAYTHLLSGAPDHLTWAPLGPGAVRGMNRALGRNTEKSMSQEEYCEVGQEQLRMLPEWLRGSATKLTLHDVASNVNCETFKYLRIKDGGYGRKYHAHH